MRIRFARRNESDISAFKFVKLPSSASFTKTKMATSIPLRLISHNRRIGILYKKWLRHLEGDTNCREEYRYNATLLRAEFDCMLYEKDMRKSKQMLLDKEEEFLRTFPIDPPFFPSAPRGVAYNRDKLFEDFVLDFWHPLEKAIYPDYFAKRELRKQQYLEMWEKKHGPPPPSDH